MKNNRKTNLIRILRISFICLIAGHLVLGAYFPSAFINLMGLAVLFIILFITCIQRNDVFSFILIIYFCSHFRYGVSNGGTFNLIAFFVILAFFFFQKRVLEIEIKDRWINILLLVLIFFNILGWMTKNPSPRTDLLFGIISFFGYIAIFILISRTYLSEKRLNLFVSISIVLTVYLAFTSLNSYFGIIKVASPLIWGVERVGSLVQSSMLGDSELYGEHGLLILLFYIPFLLSTITKTKIYINEKFLYFGILFSSVNLLLSRSRSVFMLGVTGIILLFFFLRIFDLKVINKTGKFIPGLLTSIVVLFLAGQLININYVFERLGDVEFDELSVSGFITGEKINRSYAFSFALERLKSDSWQVGFGWGTIDSNRTAWFVDPEVPRADSHSLYLSLPMIFGWIGSAAFLGIILITLFRLNKLLIDHRRSTSYLLLPALGFSLMLVFFLFNQYKINAMRWPHYYMIVWVWLGMANAVINSFKYNQKLAKKSSHFKEDLNSVKVNDRQQSKRS